MYFYNGHLNKFLYIWTPVSTDIYHVCVCVCVCVCVYNIIYTQMEWEMATHSSVLAWRIPWTEEPGGLPSKGPHRVKNNWMTEYTYIQRKTFAYSD